MILKTKLFGRVYEFKSVKEVLAKANEYKHFITITSDNYRNDR